MRRPGSAIGSELLPFETVYDRFAAPVYRFCLSQLRRRADAEDVAADVFESALRAYDRDRPPPERVLSWLLTIARNAVIDHQRRGARRLRILGRYFGADVDRGADDAVAREIVARDEMRRVLAAAQRLSHRDRLLIGLRLAAELSYADIAEIVGMSAHAATVATRRAVQRLRARMEEEP